MLFNSYEFIFIFLPVSLCLYYLVFFIYPNKIASIVSITSLFFYAYWSLSSLPILILSILLNYTGGEIIKKRSGNSNLFLFIILIITNLTILGYYKYWDFIITDVVGNKIELIQDPNSVSKIIMPIGISFFTFTQIAYLFDCYKSKQKIHTSITKYTLFVTFFPHLIAGPIIHHNQIVPQFDKLNKQSIESYHIALGLVFFIIGLAKKVLIADELGNYSNFLHTLLNYGIEPKILAAWLGSISYSLQLYFDFSGYSDMAIGIALFYGIILPINFNSPYKSTSLIEFWSKWHMSMTKYFTNYLYNPIALNMSRLGSVDQNFNYLLRVVIIPVMITFVIIGLWHGANWTFILFGLLHGFGIVVNHYWRWIKKHYRIPKIFSDQISKVFWWLITMIYVNFCFVFFRSKDLESAYSIIKGMIGINGIELPSQLVRLFNLPEHLIGYVWQVWFAAPNSKLLILYILLSFIIILFFPSSTEYLNKERANKLFSEKWYLKVLNFTENNLIFAVVLGIIFGFTLSKLGETGDFLYFNF
jgi:alginate O-acetyltransferase complex protein AlgI